MNVATVLLGDYDEDLPEKLAWVRPLRETYGHQVFVACRTQKPVDAFNTAGIAAESSETPGSTDRAQQTELEEWLGVAFRHLVCRDWRLFDRKRCHIWYDEPEMNNYVAGQVIFLKDFFLRNNIKVLVIGLESYLFHLIAYHVAMRLGIPVVQAVLRRLPRCGVMFCKNNYLDMWKWNDDTRDASTEMLSIYESKEIITTNKPKIALGKYWHPRNFMRNVRFLADYYFWRRGLVRKHKYEEYLRLNTMSVVRFTLAFFIRKLLNSWFLRFEKPDENDSYFFFPLHYENDAQMSYKEPFIDQFGIIRAVARTLPMGIWLYLKPHPHYMATDVSFLELRNLLKLGNIKLIYPAVSPVSLLKDSIGVITINSTTGFEALVYHKPVITFGHDFYCKEDLCYLIRDMNHIPEVIFKVLRERKPPSSQQAIDDFTATVYKNTVFTEGELNNTENPITEDDGRNIAAALDKIFGQIAGSSTREGAETSITNGVGNETG